MPRPLAPCLALLALAAACNRSGATPAEAAAKVKAKDDRPPLVRVRPVEVRKVRQEIRDTAYLEAERRVTIQAKVAGRVDEVRVDEGQIVQQGQLLARLDDRQAKTTLAQVEVQLAEARLRRDLSELEAEASGGRLEQARIEREMAAAEWKRNSAIDPQIISPKTLDDSKFLFEKAEEALRVADYGKRKADIEVKTAANKIDELESKLNETKLQLAEHEIVAPFDGVVVQRDVTGGETISSATSLFVLADPHRLIAYVSRPQRELPLVRTAKEVRFTTDADPKHEFVADVDMVSPVVDEATGTIKLRMRVREADVKVLVPGMFLRVRVMTEDERDALMVPKAAVLAEGDRSIVFAVRDGRATKVLLDPGLEERDFIECKSRADDGLSPQDTVIVSGHEDLKDQTPVEVSPD
ncbi:MAG: efflux RND transporter periplasmic adaptor subunit [Planctomycetota bacterium]